MRFIYQCKKINRNETVTSYVDNCFDDPLFSIADTSNFSYTKNMTGNVNDKSLGTFLFYLSNKRWFLIIKLVY